jgi:hypothetical protein
LGATAVDPNQAQSLLTRRAHERTPVLSPSMNEVSFDTMTRLEASTDSLRNHDATVSPGPAISRLGADGMLASPVPSQCRKWPLGPPDLRVVAAESAMWLPWPDRSSARVAVTAAWSYA